jgi:hypothetical protein
MAHTFAVHHGRVELLVFESCHSTWLFDRSGHRFRRILKGVTSGDQLVTTEWRPYYDLHVDPDTEAFSVILNPEGSRLLRSWRHTHDCDQCGGHATNELSLDELSYAIG